MRRFTSYGFGAGFGATMSERSQWIATALIVGTITAVGLWLLYEWATMMVVIAHMVMR